MAVTLADISKLRTMTGAGMMDCKNALTEANNDFEKAIEIIRKKGKAIAAKRSDREAAQGCVLAAAKDGFAAIVAIKCETDFVAKNADFIALTQQALDCAIAGKITSTDALLAAQVNGRSIADLITGYFETVQGAQTVAYIHPGNMLASIVALNEVIDEKEARTVAMQVAASAPVAINREGVPAKMIETELEVGKEKARAEGKPEAMLDKIAQGRLNKFFQESTLLEQEFIMDNKLNVKSYLQSISKTLTVSDFKRVTLNQE